jgi:hypothetical protein
VENLKEKLFDLWWLLNSEVVGCSVGYSVGQEISGFFELEVSLLLHRCLPFFVC